MARLESRFFVHIDNSLLVIILLRHGQQKLLSLYTSMTRYPELGPGASWLAWRVYFFVDIDNSRSLMVKIL